MKRTSKSKSVTHKNYFVFILIAIPLTVTISYLWNYSATEKSTVVVSTKVSYPVQYSDTHITQNAVISDTRFRAITFSGAMGGVNLANVISALPPNMSTTTGVEDGTWLWTPILEITPKYRDGIISGATKNGIKNIYISIDSYLDIYSMPAGSEKVAKQKKFDAILADFVKEAHKHNITVDAEGGWRNWAENGHTYKALAVVDYVISFNKTHAEKFRGFQYDVEPYLLDRYPKNKQSVLTNFLDLVGATVARLYGSDLTLSVVIPEFYDGTLGDTPIFSYAGKPGSTVTHLLRLLDHRANSNIIVMSYRNFSKGTDGSIEISKNEILEADKHYTKVVVAQETGDVEPAYITFHQTSRKYYNKQVTEIQKAFAGDSSYGGIATHYVNSFLQL